MNDYIIRNQDLKSMPEIFKLILDNYPNTILGLPRHIVYLMPL